VVEITFRGNKLDHAGMLVDFGLMKNVIKPFIDSFDHCHVICQYDDPEYVEFFKNHNRRYIIVPFNPSAEMLAIMIHMYVQRIISNTEFTNGEGGIRVEHVTIHETATGSATSDWEDVENYWDFGNWHVSFSEEIMSNWPVELINLMSGPYKIKNPEIKQQICIPGFNNECFNN
jgi:6-pyruvoyltetrahydropterin/6-carboxytetrahydropterin synthase